MQDLKWGTRSFLVQDLLSRQQGGGKKQRSSEGSNNSCTIHTVLSNNNRTAPRCIRQTDSSTGYRPRLARQAALNAATENGETAVRQELIGPLNCVIRRRARCTHRRGLRRSTCLVRLWRLGMFMLWCSRSFQLSLRVFFL